MPDSNLPTLLTVVQQRFGVVVDPDSNGGQILNSLTPDLAFDDQALEGQADVAPLTFVTTTSGVSVRAAQGGDMLVFSLPAGPIHFALIPPGAAHPVPQVELTLLSLPVPVPFLRPAQVNPDDGTLQEAGDKVELHFPDLLLVVTASTDVSASARLAPSHDAVGAQEVTMTPPFALIGPGPGTVLGFGFDRATLKLDGPDEQEIDISDLDIYIAPPGIPALAMHGGGHNLSLRLGMGGDLSGEFSLALADGEQAAARPRFLHHLAAHLHLNRNAVTLLELSGQIDIPGWVSARLGPLDDPDPPGPVDYTLSLRLDNGWQASLLLSASGGQDYLWRTPRSDPNASNIARNTLGAYAVFTPLLMPALPGAGSSGYVELLLGSGAAAGLAASGTVSTQSVTLYGGELQVRQPAVGHAKAFLFFDLETELQFKVKIGTTDLLATRRPIKVRHKAIGLCLDFGSNGGSPQLNPVFDPVQGFSLDLSDPGAFDVPEPLGDIVQAEGARMARENPLYFEIDLVLKADLGVVTVDRASIRIPLDTLALPTLTALGAHIDVPGALSGNGYLKLEQTGGFDGGLDATLPAFGIRVSASLSLTDKHDVATGEDVKAVLIGLGVEFPVPVPLANSGLGLFGFLGLFGMHFARNQQPATTPLDWFVSENLANGDAGNIDAWKAVAHNWALGMGAVFGTIEGGFLIHAKGMIVIELPGPGLLLVMNADILSPRPDTRGSDTGKFLAVIEVRLDELTMGVVADYGIKPLLSFRVPVQAAFNFAEPEQWSLDVGGIPPKMPISVKFLSVLRADGYLLIHGNGIPDFPLRPLQGFSVAAGIRAAFTWGPEKIGLYLKVAAQADVGVSFKPFLIIGKMVLKGELHLFIIGIEVSASAKVFITPDTYFISARVCGSVDFFFFDVTGCVKLELGAMPSDMPSADPLLRTLSLHSRSPALLTGSATAGPVDGSLGSAAYFDDANAEWVGDLPTVPIDAIPVLQMEMRTVVDPGCMFLGQPVAPLQPEKSWLRRGERFYRYTFKSLDLSGMDKNGVLLAAPVGEGDTPTVWWDRYGRPHQGDDNDVQLALLSWIPDPTPSAAERTVSLDERTKRRWGDVCSEVAGPASVLWTFRQTRLGPSPSGWTLQGQPWPDLPGMVRSSPAYNTLRVTEPWRSGNLLADGLTQATPAYISGAQSLPERLLFAPQTGQDLRPVVPDDEQFATLFGALRPQGSKTLADALRLNTNGLQKVRLLLVLNAGIWYREGLVLQGLDDVGNVTDFRKIINKETSRQINGLNDLLDNHLPDPDMDKWINPRGPWLPTVDAVSNAWLQLLGVQAKPLELVLVLFGVDPPEGIAQLEIGLATDRPYPGLTWGLLIVEGLPQAEVERSRYDEENRQRTITTVNGALHADQAKRALLHPGSSYTLSVSYDVEVTDADDKGQPLDDKDHQPIKEVGKKQQFRFKTDTQPPTRLDPWVMTTDPGPAENFFFYGDPLRVIFATDATRKLYSAYNYDLFAVVKAASGNHPQAGPGLDAAQVKLVDAVVQPQGVAAAAMTPFESSLRTALAGQPCINTDHSTNMHERVTLTMKLEPHTDYILDLQARQSNTGEQDANQPAYPMFRRHFSTSRYASLAELVAAVKQTSAQHRRVADATPLAMLATQNPGSSPLQIHDKDMEQMLRALAWGDLARPGVPHLVVIWQDGAGGATPRPVAVLLDTPEPLWRSRNVPVEVTDQNGIHRYQLQPQPWLDLVEQPGAAPLITRFLCSNDGGRTLIMLQPTARGSTLNLLLRRTHHPLFEGDTAIESSPLAKVSLAMAPWEDQS